mgnify:CR=1 FL=1
MKFSNSILVYPSLEGGGATYSHVANDQKTNQSETDIFITQEGNPSAKKDSSERMPNIDYSIHV